MTARSITTIATTACAALALSACTSPALSDEELEQAWAAVLNWDVALTHDVDVVDSGLALDTDVSQDQLDAWLAEAEESACSRFASTTAIDDPSYSSRGYVIEDVLRERRFLLGKAAQSEDLAAALNDVYGQLDAEYPTPDLPPEDATDEEWEAHIEAWETALDNRDRAAEALFAEQYPELVEARAEYIAIWTGLQSESESEEAYAAVQRFLIDTCDLKGTDADKIYTPYELGIVLPEAEPDES